MKTRRLGRNGPELSAVGLGCMGMSALYGGRDGNESVRTLHRAVDLGVTFFDSADAYANGANQTLVGRELKGVRDRVFIATKFANTRGLDGQRTGISGKPDYVRSACDASLKRLGVDVIDLYYQHRVDPDTPIEDTVGAMAGLVQAGKVRFLGLSEASPATIRRAHAVHPITALQTEYSLWSREPEADILPVLRELGIGFVPAHLQRQPVLGSPLQDPQVSVGVPPALRIHRGCQGILSTLFLLVQSRPPSRRHRPDDTRSGPLRPGKRRPRRPTANPRRRVRRTSRTLRQTAAHTTQQTYRRLDQPTPTPNQIRTPKLTENMSQSH